MSKIFAIVAHPDDEILGMGGTLRKHIINNDDVYALILGEGETSRNSIDNKSDDRVSKLHKNMKSASDIIGFKDTFCESLPDNRFDSINLLDIVKIIESYIEKYRPEIIYTHHGGDLNIDHRLTFQAVLTATRPIGDYTVKAIYGAETVSSTEWMFGEKDKSFFPNMYVDISETIDAKCAAMLKYTSELREPPHPRSIDMLEAIGKVRGMTIGAKYAEAFEVIRIVR